MRSMVHLAGFALVLVGSLAQATDFAPLMGVVHATWPDKTHLGVIADYRQSQAEIEGLAQQLGAGNSITVLDTHGLGELERAGNLLVNRVKPDYLVLLPGDPVVWDGSYQASRLVGRAAAGGIPTIATTAKALNQGAVFAMGAGTGFNLLVTERMIGTVEVILPDRTSFVSKVGRMDQGAATIRVASVR